MDTTRPSLLVRIRDCQDSAAWGLFDDIYRPILHRFAAARGLSHADAEDIVQQCMTAISTYIQSFDYDPARGRFRTWLQTMVNNKVRNLVRDRRDHPAGGDRIANVPTDDDSPEDIFEKIWRQQHIWHCLRQIEGEVDATTFTAFQHYVIEERPIEEICAALSLKPNNVYTIKWRLTQRLSEKMTELLGGDE